MSGQSDFKKIGNKPVRKGLESQVDGSRVGLVIADLEYFRASRAYPKGVFRRVYFNQSLRSEPIKAKIESKLKWSKGPSGVILDLHKPLGVERGGQLCRRELVNVFGCEELR